MARVRLLPPPAQPARSPREMSHQSFSCCRERWNAAKPRHIIPATHACVRRRATGVDPRRSAAAVPTAQADREFCHAHAGMGAWMGQYLGGVHALLTTAVVARCYEHPLCVGVGARTG